jgi:hypothetical protein
MKKMMLLLTVCLLVIGMSVMAAVPASAATPKESIVAAVKENLPAKYADQYVPMVENILQQIDVTEAQAATVIDCIEACKGIITTDKGGSLSDYSSEEVSLVLDQFDIACKALNLKYEFVTSATPAHEGDIYCVIYNAAGNKLADIDADAVKKTNVADPVNYGYAVLAAVLVLGAVAAGIYSKKALAVR